MRIARGIMGILILFCFQVPTENEVITFGLIMYNIVVVISALLLISPWKDIK
jgi:hypothetical protein